MADSSSVSTGTGHIDLSVFDFPYLKFLLVIWGIYLLVFLGCSFFIPNKKNLKINLIVGCGIISLGFVTGVIMGNNRNPISDTIMSSVFTLLGGIVVYLFAQKNTEDGHENKSKISIETLVNNENKLLVALVLILFPLSLLYGTHIGARFRNVNETYNSDLSYNRQLGLDTLEIWKKTREAEIEQDKVNLINYYQAAYNTWSENEKKRYQKQLSLLKKNDTLPAVPAYISGK